MTAPVPAPAASPNKLDAIFQSMKGGGEGSTALTGEQLLPLALLGAAVVLMFIALKYWHHKRVSPRALRSHRKLLAEATRSTPGVSRRQMQALSGLANDAGLSSPLVALICPSAIGRLASNVREDRQRTALRAVAEGLVRAERKRPSRK